MNTKSPENLVGVAGKWRTIRSHYPGWVIAPDKCREELWEFTQNWIDPIFSTMGNLNLGDALFVLYELNWRLEVALCPLLLSQAETIVKLLDAVDKHVAESAGKRGLSDTAKEQVTALSFAILRESREDLDAERFDAWSKRVLALIGSQTVHQCRWHYEQCLFNLNALKHRRVEEELLRWTPNPDLPFWESKRASILAELGNFKEAEEIAENALEIIRSRLRPFVTDYALLSQEGLVMSLLRAVKLQVRIQRRAAGDLKDKDGYSLRWSQLETYGCNPWKERRVLELAVSAPAPKLRTGKELIRGFDPGHMTVSSHHMSHDYFYEYRPGFALLRFFEEGGIPLRCGSVTTSGTGISKAATWIEPFAPLWALVSNFRADDEKAIDAAFDRVRVATLMPKEIETIFSLMMEAANQGINAFAAGNMHDATFVTRLLPLICELLSRMAFRLETEKLQSLMNFAVSLYGIPARAFDTHESLSHLFFRIIDAADETQIGEWFPMLLSLPVPGEGGFDIHEHARQWPEPADYISRGRLRSLQLGNVPELKKIAANLIRIAKDGAPISRKHAIARVAGLFDAGLLDDADSAAFGRAIWSHVDQKRGLPEGTPFLSFAFLNYPSPNPNLVITNLRAWLLTEVPEVISTVQVPGNPQRPSFGGGMAASYYFRNLRGASRRMWAPRSSEKLIKWTSKEIKILLVHFAGWLSREKQFLGTFPDIRAQFEELKTVLGQIVLPRLTSKDAEALNMVQAMTKELEEADVQVLVLLVGLEKCGREQEGLENRIMFALKDKRPEQVEDAVEAIFMWCFYFQSSSSSGKCLKLVRGLISRLIILSEPCLRESIQTTREIIQYFPDVMTATEIEWLDVALAHLLDETTLTETMEARFARPEVMAIARSEKPIIRTFSASLAATVSDLCHQRKLPQPESVQRWKLVCKSDSLPEVRRAWLPSDS